ncbi:MltA-interacting protein MipA [compost metagenome]
MALFGTWAHRFDARWSAVTTVGVNTLVGDARDSPLTEKKTNVFANVGVVYAF